MTLIRLPWNSVCRGCCRIQFWFDVLNQFFYNAVSTYEVTYRKLKYTYDGMPENELGRTWDEATVARFEIRGCILKFPDW